MKDLCIAIRNVVGAPTYATNLMSSDLASLKSRIKKFSMTAATHPYHGF